MGVWYDEPEYKELQKEWYQKLKDSGFEDAESSPKYLKQWHSRYFFIRNTPEKLDQTIEYYDMSLHFYWHYRGFQNIREKEIWWLHCQGLSRREIAADLTERNEPISDSLVQIILARLKKIMHSQLWPSSEGLYDSEEGSDHL